MSDPFELKTTFGRRPLSGRPGLLGDEFQLKLDPALLAQMEMLRLKLSSESLLSSWLNPDLGTLQMYLQRSPNLRLSNSSLLGSAPNPPRGLQPLNLRPQPVLFTPGQGPEQPKPGDVADLMKAIWGVPQVKKAVTELGDQVRGDLWSNRTVGEKSLLLGTAALIGGGTMYGIFNQKSSRVWVLDKVNGTDIPIPGVSGASVRLYARDGSINGVGGTAKLGRGFTLTADTKITELPNDVLLRDTSVFLKWDVLEGLPSLLKRRF